MATNLTDIIKKVRTALRGEEVRGSIADGLEFCGQISENAKADMEATAASTKEQLSKDIDAKAAAALKSIPESYTELDGSVKQLKEDLANRDKGYSTLKLYANFTNGTLLDGEFSFLAYRVSTNDVIDLGRDVILKIKEGFRIALHFFENGSYVGESRWVTSGSYKVTDGKCFKLCIARVTESTSEIADIDEFVDTVTFNTLTEEKIRLLSNDVVTANESAKRAAENFNIFNLPLYHHLNQEEPACNIPAQSLYDIQYAKRLGFNLIEANPHKCADGVYVCKHGRYGKFGAGLKALDGNDYSTTLFSSITSTWLRENITYDTNYGKHSGFIPTLDEFCEECKKLNMMVKLYGYEGVLDVARKYLTDDMIWLTATKRGHFRGTIEYIWDGEKEISELISECIIIGAPLNIVIEAGKFDSLSDEKIIELCTSAHENGFTVGTVYPTSKSLLRAFSLGVDVAGSTVSNVNFLKYGTDKNITALNSTDLVLTNATYDAENYVINIINGGSIAVNEDNAFRSGITSLRIRYDGNLTIKNVDNTNKLENYESDGNSIVEFSVVRQEYMNQTHTKWLDIVANEDTIIYDIELHCSRIS